MKFSDLTDQQKFEMYQAAKSGAFKQPSDIDAYLASKEPTVLDKALGARDTAENYLLDKFLPKKTPESLTPEQTQDLQQQKQINGTRSWEQADKWLGSRVGEQPLNLLDNPRFIAHPEIARGLNSLASLANVASPTNDLLRAAGIGSGPRMSDIGPTSAKVAKLAGFNPSVRDAASLGGDLGIVKGMGALGNAAQAAAEKDAALKAYTPSTYTGPKAPEAPTLVPNPAPPYASAEAQNVADMIRRKDALGLQQRASKGLLDTLGQLKEKGLSNAGTAAKVVNSYDLPISQESTEALAQAFPDHPEVQKLQAAMSRTATGEARTKGNLVAPSEKFVVDKGERTPISTIPTSDPVIGQPHPDATLDYTQDPRFKTQFQEGMKQTSFPFDPLVGEAAYTTTEPIDPTAPVLGREGQQELYTRSSDIGKPDQTWHTPETQAAYGGGQKTLPIEDNPDFYKLLQLANNHAKYAPNGIEPLAMEARQARMGRVADELRSTLKGINEPLPGNLSEEDLSNITRAGGEGTTGERIQNVRNDTTKRMGLQEDLAPIARGDKELALINRTKGVNDTRAMAQELAHNYNLPQLLNESDVTSQAEKHIGDQEQYFKDLEATNKENTYNKQRFEDQNERYQERLDKFNRAETARYAKHLETLAQFGNRSWGILPSQKDLSNLAAWSTVAPIGTVASHLAVKNAGKLAGWGLLNGGKALVKTGAMGMGQEMLKGPWQRASLLGNVLAPKEDQNDK